MILTRVKVLTNKIIIEKEIINKGEYNIHNLEFEFVEEYNNLIKKIVLSNEKDSKTYFIQNDEFVIPREFLKEIGDLEIGIYAEKLTIDENENKFYEKVYSPFPDTIQIIDGSYKEQDTSDVNLEEPDILTQLTDDVNELKEDNSKIKEKLNSVEENAQENKIESISVNNEIQDIQNKKVNIEVPTKLSQLDEDSTHKSVTDEEKQAWNNKSDFSGNYNDLSNKPIIPDELSDLTEDSTHRLVGDTDKENWNNKYDKPVSGIPKNDLADDVKASLRKADSAVQDINYVHTDNNYTNEEKQKLASLENYNDTDIKQDITDLQNSKANTSDLNIYATNQNLNTEKINRENADIDLQAQIDAITSASDVVDVLGTYSELQNYNTSSLTEDDVVKVLQDSTHNNALSYFRWVITNNLGTWVYVGSEGPFYTKGEVNELLNQKQNSINSNNKLDSDLVDDSNSTNKFVTTTEKQAWNNKSDFSGNYNDLSNKPEIPDELSDLADDSTHRLVSDTEKTNWNNKEDSINKTTTINSSSTNTQYPSAKSVYDKIKPLDDKINGVEKVSGIGTEISLKNTLEAKLKINKLSGQKEQETTKGQQLFNYQDTNSVSNEFSVDEDGWITLNITNSTSSDIFLNYWTNPKLDLKESTPYAIFLEVKNVVMNGFGSIRPVSSGVSQFSTDWRLPTENLQNNKIYKNIVGTLNSFSNATTMLRTYLALSAGSSINITFRISVIEDTNVTIDDFVYEKYTNGASPNSNYPQQIKTVTGLQTVNITRKNILPNDLTSGTINGVTVTVNEDKSITFNGTATSNGIFYLCNNINRPIKTGTYTLSTHKSGSISSWFYINTIYQTAGGKAVELSTESSNTFDLTSDTLLRCSLQFNTGTVFDNFTIYPMLEKNNQTTTYEPYNSNIYELNLGKNKFNPSKIITGYGLDNNNGNLYKQENRNCLDYTEVLPNTIYSKSGFVTVVIVYYDKSKTFISSLVGTQNLINFTTPSNCKYVRISFNNTVDYTEAQFEERPEPTAFSEYFEPIEVYEENYFYKQNNKFYFHEEYKKIVLDSSEDWQYSNLLANVTGFTNNDVLSQGADTTGANISTHFPYLYDYSSNTEHFYISTENKILLYISNNIATTVAELKTWLSNNNVTLWYKLATPTDTEITSTNYPELYEQLVDFFNATSYNGETNIEVDGDLPIILDLEAYTNTSNGKYEYLLSLIYDLQNEVSELKNV